MDAPAVVVRITPEYYTEYNKSNKVYVADVLPGDYCELFVELYNFSTETITNWILQILTDKTLVGFHSTLMPNTSWSDRFPGISYDLSTNPLPPNSYFYDRVVLKFKEKGTAQIRIAGIFPDASGTLPIKADAEHVLKANIGVSARRIGISTQFLPEPSSLETKIIYKAKVENLTEQNITSAYIENFIDDKLVGTGFGVGVVQGGVLSSGILSLGTLKKNETRPILVLLNPKSLFTMRIMPRFRGKVGLNEIISMGTQNILEPINKIPFIEQQQRIRVAADNRTLEFGELEDAKREIVQKAAVSNDFSINPMNRLFFDYTYKLAYGELTFTYLIVNNTGYEVNLLSINPTLHKAPTNVRPALLTEVEKTRIKLKKKLKNAESMQVIATFKAPKGSKNVQPKLIASIDGIGEFTIAGHFERIGKG